MNFFDAILYGIVEGITEFLPISSTGHLILFSHILGNAQTEFLKSFEIMIQLGAILAVVVLYWKKFFVEGSALIRVLAGFVPTAVLGLLLYPFVKGFLLESTGLVLWALLGGGIVIILFEYFHKEKESDIKSIKEIPFTTAVVIGLFQVLAMVPGVSRSAATIIGGLASGLSRKTIVEFSFLLAVPTMVAASGWDLLQTGSLFNIDQVGFLLVGFVASFAVAILAIKVFVRFIGNHTFISFGIYRVVLAILFWVIFL